MGAKLLKYFSSEVQS